MSWAKFCLQSGLSWFCICQLQNWENESKIDSKLFFQYQVFNWICLIKPVIQFKNDWVKKKKLINRIKSDDTIKLDIDNKLDLKSYLLVLLHTTLKHNPILLPSAISLFLKMYIKSHWNCSGDFVPFLCVCVRDE